MQFSVFSNLFNNRKSPSKEEIDEIFRNIILEYMNHYDYDIACENLREFVDEYPHHNEAVNTLGKYLIRAGKIEEGLKVLREHLEIMENDAETWLILGRYFEEERNYENALECFEKIVEMHQNNWKFNYRVSTIHLSLKNYHKAIEYMERFLENEKNDAESYLFLGEAYKETGEIDKAILNYEKSLELDNGSFVVPGELVKLYAVKGNLKENLPQLVKKVPRLENDHYFKYDLGKVFEYTGELDKAALKYTEFGEYYYDRLVGENDEYLIKNYSGILNETLKKLKRVDENNPNIEKWMEILK